MCNSKYQCHMSQCRKLTSPNCSTETVQKQKQQIKTISLRKILKKFPGKKSGESARKTKKQTKQKTNNKKDRMSRTREKFVKWNQMTAWDSRQEGDIRHPQPPFGGGGKWVEVVNSNVALPCYNSEWQYVTYLPPAHSFRNVSVNIKAFQFSREKKTLLSFLVHRIHTVTECQIFVNWGYRLWRRVLLSVCLCLLQWLTLSCWLYSPQESSVWNSKSVTQFGGSSGKERTRFWDVQQGPRHLQIG